MYVVLRAVANDGSITVDQNLIANPPSPPNNVPSNVIKNGDFPTCKYIIP
jgi:hypothetical protein